MGNKIVLIQARSLAGMTQARLAEEAGTTRVVISYLESGKRFATVATREGIEKALGMKVDWVGTRLQADGIRRGLLERYSGQERLEEMTFDEKKALLHWWFDGKEPDGVPYGIYVNKLEKERGAPIEYFLYGRLTGVRTVKGDEIDWDPEDSNTPRDSGSTSESSGNPGGKKY